MHKIEEADLLWQPMVIDLYIFPSVDHDAFAFLEAQTQKMISYTTLKKCNFDIDILTRGVMLLKDIHALETAVRPIIC
jgi:hypothetical protein